MCRWMAWHGQPVLIEELLFKTRHGIVDQSLHSRMGAEPTNGDGFGLGWYGGGEGPAVYHSVAPAWGNANLRELAAHVESPMFLAHVRAAIGSSVTQQPLAQCRNASAASIRVNLHDVVRPGRRQA
jgi:predicted glutamine amidotransferase